LRQSARDPFWLDFLCNFLSSKERKLKKIRTPLGPPCGTNPPKHYNFVPKLITMAAEIITSDDLREFKIELLDEFRKIIKENGNQPVKKWLKSPEVRKLLNISPGTLQNLRINGTLPFTRMGGVIYYDYEDIHKVLTENKRHNRY
jgi:hypothetical protein